MVESISDYYRRNADREREIAAQTADPVLRRIHTQNAQSFERRAASIVSGRP